MTTMNEGLTVAQRAAFRLALMEQHAIANGRAVRGTVSVHLIHNKRTLKTRWAHRVNGLNVTREAALAALATAIEGE